MPEEQETPTATAQDGPIAYPPSLVLRLQGCDVIELDLARRLLYECGFRQRREGDDVLLFAPAEGEAVSRTKPFYARADEAPADSACGSLYVDEGFYSDTLRADGTRGYNSPWAEMVDMTSLLGTLVRVFEPGAEVKPSPYIGRGKSGHFMMAQYVKILVEGDQAKHPSVRIER